MSWYSFRPYVPVAQRRANAAREMAKLSKKTGRAASPVVLDGRKIATTFWGKAWCDNLEAYSDFANRLPRGRTYVRNGSVVDLEISPGNVRARVSGSELYSIDIKIKPLPTRLWKSIQTECAGQIDSLIELLQGKLSSSVMQIVTRRDGGLFPTPKEIDLHCSCPDWADLCKHVAACLYGVGARLDQSPELLFLLRGVNPAELISQASAADAVRQTATTDGAPALTDKELTDVFGIELADVQVPIPPAAKMAKPMKLPEEPAKPAAARVRKAKSSQKTRGRLSAPAKERIVVAGRGHWTKGAKPAARPQPARRELSPAGRAKMVAGARARWAAFKAKAKQPV